LAEDYRGKAYPLCDRLRDIAEDLLSQADLTVTQHGMVHPNILALALLSRTLSNFKALGLLTRQRMVVEARILARCCFENLFIIGGLHAEGIAFAERMIEDDRAGRKGRVRFACENDSIFQALSPEIQMAVKQRHEEFRTAPRVGFLKQRDASDAGPFKDMYVVYSQFSGDAAHPTVTALSRHWGPEGERTAYFNVNPEPREEELDETLHLSCVALISMLVVVNEMVGYTEAGKKLPAVNHELKMLQTERWGIESIEEGIDIQTEPDGSRMACLWRVRVLRLERSRGAGVFGTVLKYADLPKVRAWRAGAQLDIAGVFAVRKSESALPVLFSELSTGQEARAVPASGLRVPCVFIAH
jgi:hypothetical protein